MPAGGIMFLEKILWLYDSKFQLSNAGSLLLKILLNKYYKY